jgi:hypothetical protein
MLYICYFVYGKVTTVIKGHSWIGIIPVNVSKKTNDKKETTHILPETTWDNKNDICFMVC